MTVPDPQTPALDVNPYSQLIDAPAELVFIRDLLSRTVLSKEQLETISTQIHQIETRAKDSTLHLAVLGEFSSGKSTFINALLRRPLLKSAHQATTAAATLIGFGSEFSLKIHFERGVVVTGSERDFAALRNKLSILAPNLSENATIQDLLDLVTVEPSVAKQVVQVELMLTAPTLRSGISIIDTPGIGAGAAYAQNHDAVTGRVIADIADAAVVLIPADNPMTRTLITFLTETAGRFLHRCIFVITKMDHIDGPEQPAVREFVEAKLGQIVGKKPLILQSAATTMLPVKQVPASLQESWAYWRASFVTMEKSLQQELARSRAVIISERLATLLHSLLTGLQTAVATKRGSVARERIALEGNSVIELERVLGRLLESCRSEIDEEIDNCKVKTRGEAVTFESRAKQTISELLDGADKTTLSNVVNIDIPAGINRRQDEFDQASKSHLISLRSRCDRVQRLFVEQFENNYKNLRALGVNLQVPSFTVSASLAAGHFSSAGGFLQASEQKRAELGAKVGKGAGCIAAPFSALICGFLGGCGGCSFSDGSFGGDVSGFFFGAIVGAIIGFVAPIVAGGFMGASVGSKMSNLAQQREEVRSMLLPEIASYVQTSMSSRLQDYDIARGTIVHILDQVVRAHTREYSGAVNRMLEEHHSKVSVLAQQEKQAEIDSGELLKRTRRLDETRSRLLAVGS